MESCGAAEATASSSSSDESPVVELSVSGTSFVVLRSTLSQTNWIFARDIENVPQGVYYDGKYFIDADPISFRWVLQFVRCKTLPDEVLGSPMELSALNSLADFLCFGDLVDFIGEERQRFDSSLKARYAKLQDENRSLKAYCDDLEKNNDSVNALFDDLKEYLTRMEENHKEEKGNLEEKNSFLLAKTNRLTLEKEAMEEKISNLETENVRVGRQVQKLRGRILREKTRLEGEVQNLQDRMERDQIRLEGEVKNLRNRSEIEKAQLEEEVENLLDRMDSDQIRLEGEVNLRNRSEREKIRLEGEVKNLRNRSEIEKTRLEGEVENLRDSLEECKDKATESGRVCSVLRTECGKFRSMCTKRTAKLKSFREFAESLEGMTCKKYRCRTLRHHRPNNICNKIIIVLENDEHDITIDCPKGKTETELEPQLNNYSERSVYDQLQHFVAG